MLLNSLSTATMVRLGRTYSNLMIGMHGRNAKLSQRQVRILVEASGASEAVCRTELARCDGDLRLALLCLLTGSTPGEAAPLLASQSGSVRAAMTAIMNS
jgi:N-acetylmuramic acid 6-phosphate etherase